MSLQGNLRICQEHFDSQGKNVGPACGNPVQGHGPLKSHSLISFMENSEKKNEMHFITFENIAVLVSLSVEYDCSIQ